MKATVVVPTYKRREKLRRCLIALMTQTLDPALYEIVVCDDAGEADLAADLRREAARFERCVVHVLPPAAGRRGPAAARNNGWRAAAGEWIAFTDDDCVPAPDWLERGLSALELSGADAGQGRIVVPLRECPTDFELNAAKLEGAPCATANFFARRAAIAAVGGFDERFRRPWREDSDLHFSLLEKGFKVVRLDEAVVVHPIAPARWGYGLRQQANSYYDALLFKKHPDLYRRFIGGPPWQYYVVAGCLLVGVGGLLTGSPAAAPALAGWALWTAGFCARRLKGATKRPAHLAEMAVTSALIPPIAVFWRLRGALSFGVAFW